MKIAHVVDSMAVGGAETLVLQLCRLQRDEGHEPSIYAVGALGALGQQAMDEGFPMHYGIGKHLIDSALNFYSLFRATTPDVVHLHNPTPSIYAGPAARLAGVASIVSTRHSLVGPPRNLTMERKYALASRLSDWVVGICDATTANLREIRSAPDRKIVRVYNGTLPLRPSTRADVQKRTFTFLYVGRMEAVKNHGFLLRAFQGALAELPGLQLWMVGDGTERSRMEELSRTLGIQANVTFWGQHLDVAPFFSSSDAFVMSSVSEGLPMSLLQAFSAGIPAIVTDAGGMAEVVQLAHGGLTVPLTDVSSMKDALVRFASQSTERMRFAQNAEAAFHELFTLQAMAAAYMELYKNTPRYRSRHGIKAAR